MQGKALAWNYAITLGIVLLGGALIVLPVTLQVSGLRGEVSQHAALDCMPGQCVLCELH